MPTISFLVFLVEIASKLKKVSPTFSWLKTFPSFPSVSTSDRKQNRRNNIVLNNKPRPLFLEFS